MSEATNSTQQRPMVQDPAQVRRWRHAAGLSLRTAARRAGGSKSHLGEIETGAKGASAEMLGRLAEAYGCRVIDLLQDPPHPRADADAA